VATDIAARGIHVDDIALVIHADPPVEHKAYLHRSGRTARAGAEGTVVTLMTDAQVTDVRDLARRAGIKPTVTRLSSGHPLLAEIAPGERELVYTASAADAASDVRRSAGARRQSNGQGSGRRRPSEGARQRGGASATGTSSAAAFSSSSRSDQRRRSR